jgi:hypothetical protein
MNCVMVISGDSGRGGDGDDDNRTTTTRTRFFPHNGCGQEEEEEEEEEEKHPFQEEHVDVTNWLDLLDRSMTPPLPSES